MGQAARRGLAGILDEVRPISEAILSRESPGYFAHDHMWRLRRHGDRIEDSWFSISWSPIPDVTAPSGVGGVMVSAVETTGQHRTHAALRSRNRSLSSEVVRRTQERDQIWQVSEDLLGVATLDGYFLSVNPAWSELLGWSEDEIKRLHVSELRHPKIWRTPRPSGHGWPQALRRCGWKIASAIKTACGAGFPGR
jgi:PAS domain-containing protein